MKERGVLNCFIYTNPNCQRNLHKNNFLYLILSGDRGGLQQYMWFCKLQSVLQVQHKNKVWNPGLSIQRIATDLESCLYRLQNHGVGSKNPEFNGIILSH